MVRARFPHPYDGMGTRIRTDDTLGKAAWMWDINVSDDVTDVVVDGEGELVVKFHPETGAGIVFIFNQYILL